VVVVDSSGWIEFFTDGPKADAYARYLKNSEKVVTPAVVIYEVYKKIKRERGEEMAKLCVAQMEKTRGVPIDQSLALRAADLSLEFSLPMADSLVLAAARALGVELITSDTDFKNIPGVRVL
jgi:toxin FitB